MESISEWLARPGGLAMRLRSLRIEAGLSGRQLSEAAGWSQSKVSRIEGGQQMPSAGDVIVWAESLSLSTEVRDELLEMQQQARVGMATWRDRIRRGQVDVQQDFVALSAKASLVRHFEITAIPGLLQVPAYARRILEEVQEIHGAAAVDVSSAVAERMRRQQVLYDPEKTFEFLITEPALRWQICPSPVMREQLDRLQTVIGLERIRFGVIPLSAQIRWLPVNSVVIYTGETTVAEVETLIGDTILTGPEVADYGAAIDRLWTQAVEGEAARALIAAAAQALP